MAYSIVISTEFERRIIDWLDERRRLNALEEAGALHAFPDEAVDPDDWAASDDEAAEIVHAIAAQMGR